MKTISFRLLMALILLAGSARMYAEDGVRFLLLGVEGESVSRSNATALDSKLRQALNRTSALTEEEEAVFAVRPTMTFKGKSSTEGLVQDLTRMTADLTLEAVNNFDGTVFYSVVVPLEAVTEGSQEEAVNKMITGMKPADPVYVRFVRTARKKINDYYTENCTAILQRAQTLADTGKRGQAAKLLEGVPAESDCYQHARMLLADLGPVKADQPQKVYVVVAPEESPSTPTPRTQTPQTPAEVKPRIKISDPEAFTFKVQSCTGIRIGEQVKIVAELVNKRFPYDAYTFYFEKAIDPEGAAWDRSNLLVNGNRSCYINTPKNVKVKFTMTVKDVTPAVKEFSYLYLNMGSYTVEIYDLPITWINE